MKWFYYSLLIVGIWLLVTLQASYLSAWGIWGAALHPVLWSIVYITFFSRKNLWLFVLVGGFLLDIMNLNFGLNIIALTAVAISLNIIHRYHLALRNLLSWFFISTAAIMSYLITAFVLYNSIGVIWRWNNVVDFSWERDLMFIIMNLLALLAVFGLHNLWQYFIYDKRHK